MKGVNVNVCVGGLAPDMTTRARGARVDEAETCYGWVGRRGLEHRTVQLLAEEEEKRVLPLLLPSIEWFLFVVLVGRDVRTW